MKKGHKASLLIDAQGNHIAFMRRTSLGARRPVPIEVRVNDHPIQIKLPRKILNACAPAQLSAAFSHTQDLAGKKAIIWCTDDHKNVSKAFVGVVEKISSHGVRKWALRVRTALSPGLYDLLPTA